MCPTYLFLDQTTGVEFEEFMSISALDPYLEENKHLKQLVNGAPLIGDPLLQGRLKPSSEFKDRLKEIHATHHGSKINTW